MHNSNFDPLNGKVDKHFDRDLLFICRTPFQAFILLSIIHENSIHDFDLIYLTQDDSEEDIYYYKRLCKFSSHAQYIFIRRQYFDILNHIKAYRTIQGRFKNRQYSAIMLSSIDNLALRKLVHSHGDAAMITFDDGLSHVVKHSIYLNDSNNVRTRIYESLFQMTSMRELRKRISLHYSVYPGLEHIMPNNLIRYIDPFVNRIIPKQIKQNPVFFIGQPFHEYLESAAIERMKYFLDKHVIDFYVKHPREIEPLVSDTLLLSKAGRIAEEAIFLQSNGKRPIIYGGFSAVMFNISPVHADKTMLLTQSNPQDKYFADLAVNAGCNIQYI